MYANHVRHQPAAQCIVCKLHSTLNCPCGIPYCSKDCQKAHYKVHKRHCSRNPKHLQHMFTVPMNSVYIAGLGEVVGMTVSGCVAIFVGVCIGDNPALDLETIQTPVFQGGYPIVVAHISGGAHPSEILGRTQQCIQEAGIGALQLRVVAFGGSVGANDWLMHNAFAEQLATIRQNLSSDSSSDKQIGDDKILGLSAYATHTSVWLCEKLNDLYSVKFSFPCDVKITANGLVKAGTWVLPSVHLRTELFANLPGSTKPQEELNAHALRNYGRQVVMVCPRSGFCSRFCAGGNVEWPSFHPGAAKEQTEQDAKTIMINAGGGLVPFLHWFIQSI